MESLSDYLQKQTTTPFSVTEGATYRCDGCGETVHEKQIPILGGERKGEMKTIKQFCRCEDNQIAQEIADNKRERRRQKVWDYFDQESLIPVDLQNASLDNYDPKNGSQEDALRIARRYVDTFGEEGKPTDLIFSGSYGIGKSHLAIGITKALMEKGKTCVFIDVEQFLTLIKETYEKSNDKTEKDLFDKLHEVDVLVLDDLGVEMPEEEQRKSQWATRQIFQVANSRQGKHTIFTTNFSLEHGLVDVVGPRNFSRLMKGTFPVEMTGPDQRIEQNPFL